MDGDVSVRLQGRAHDEAPEGHDAARGQHLPRAAARRRHAHAQPTYKGKLLQLHTHVHLFSFYWNIILRLTLILLVANLTNIKWCKKSGKCLKPCHMGTHVRILNEKFPMNTNTIGFRFLISLSIGRVKTLAFSCTIYLKAHLNTFYFISVHWL